MKMTITIQGICEDFADALERNITNAVNYGCNGSEDMPSPNIVVTVEEDNGDYAVKECVMCQSKHFACELTKDGMCDDCACELKHGEEN